MNIETSDPIACLSFAVDAMREAFDLTLGLVAVDACSVPPARLWVLESVARRVVLAARVVRGLAIETADPRIVCIADRMAAERRAIADRIGHLIGTDRGDLDMERA